MSVGDEKMPKSEKLFDMLQLIKEYPNLNAKDLSRLCNVSERGIYRYLNTLANAGIRVRMRNGGYQLQEEYTDTLSDVFRETDPKTLDALMVLLSLGMESCEDDAVLERGRDLMKLIETSIPELGRWRPGEIEILPGKEKAVYHGGTITVGHSSRPDIINPILTSETISVNIMSLIFSSLVKFDDTQQPVPDLAKGWEISKDGLVWTFFLRDDVKFHDGRSLTAHDVEFTYRAIMDPENRSPLAERYEVIDGIEAKGDYVFRIFIKHPFAPFMHWLGRPIAPKHLLENTDLQNSPFNRHPVGSGPFKLASWTDDDTITLEANREYFHKDRPILDRLIFRAYPDRRVALQAMTRGKMDIALDLAASDLLFVGRKRAFRVYSASDAPYYAIILNLKSPIFRDIGVRKALDYAIDRGSIIKKQLKGHSRICTGPFSVSSWAYNPYVKPTPYSIEKAKELLEQAGWRDTDGDGVLDRNGESFEIALTVPNISDSLERIAVAIRAQLMKVGIKVKLVYINDSELYSTPLQAALVKIAAGADPDCAYRFWHSEGGNANVGSYENRTVDGLLELGKQTTDLEKRKAIYREAHKIIHDDYPAVFLASACEYIGSNYRFRDAKFSSMLYFLTTMRDWQIVDGGEKGGMQSTSTDRM
jgi:peptide/nickel transport system substrate-binding protein